MRQSSGRHRRPHRTLAGQAWAIAATLLAMALTFVFVPHSPKRERTMLPSAPDRPRLSAVPATPTPTRLAREPGAFPGRRAWAASAQDTSVRWANGYREADSDEDTGPLVRPYMPPPPEAWPLVPRPRTPEGDLLADPPRNPHRPTPEHPDDLDDLAAVIRTYLASRS